MKKQHSNKTKLLRIAFPQIVSLCYLLFVSVCIFVFNLPYQILSIYLVMSLVSFLLYWKDKRAAKRNSWRTQENTLHLTALLGGWPGALYAQQTLRHKTQKRPFKILLWVTILINITAFIWILTPEGTEFTQKWLSTLFQFNITEIMQDLVPSTKKPYLNITPMN